MRIASLPGLRRSSVLTLLYVSIGCAGLTAPPTPTASQPVTAVQPAAEPLPAEALFEPVPAEFATVPDGLLDNQKSDATRTAAPASPAPIVAEPIVARDLVLEGVPPERTHTGMDFDWGPFADLSDLEFSFLDPETGELVEIRGPYRLIYWDDERLELVGDEEHPLGPAHITLQRDNGSFWAYLKLTDREFLTRVR